jgi:hypothetical protein
MRDVGAGCTCAPTSPIPVDRASLYQSIARFRRELLQNPDLPADVVRAMFLRSLDATEILLQSVDRLQDLLEDRLRDLDELHPNEG